MATKVALPIQEVLIPKQKEKEEKYFLKKHSRHKTPENRFDRLPTVDPTDYDLEFSRFRLEELALDDIDTSNAILEAFRNNGYIVVSIPQDTQRLLLDSMFLFMEDFFINEIKNKEYPGIVQRRHKLSPTETVASEKYKMLLEGDKYFGYSKIFFENYDNLRDPEERDIFEMNYFHKDETTWPNDSFKKIATANYEVLFDIGRKVLKNIARSLKVDENFFDRLLTNDPSQDPTPATNDASNMCMFRYQDDFQIYKKSQKCMVHVDSGLVTLLPRSTFPGIEILDKSQKFFVPIEKFTEANDVLIFPGMIMEYITQGAITGAIHRVVREPKTDRYSLPFELKPNSEVLVKKIQNDFISECRLQYENTNTNIHDTVIHMAICDNCRLDIKGIRYKCSTCPDYDHCEKCWKSGRVHKEHEFIKVTKSVPLFYLKNEDDVHCKRIMSLLNMQRQNQKLLRLGQI